MTRQTNLFHSAMTEDCLHNKSFVSMHAKTWFTLTAHIHYKAAAASVTPDLYLANRGLLAQ